MINYGFISSTIDGSEKIYNPNSIPIPSSYSYEDIMPAVKDQGSSFTCVPNAISANIEWHKMLDSKKYDLSIDWIFDSRKDKRMNGMCFKDALHQLKNVGYISTSEYKDKRYNPLKIRGYAMIVSPIFMKQNLFSNGPFVMGLPVKNTLSNEFWQGAFTEGYHAVAVVGYENINGKDFLRLRNSWGTSYGENGYYSFELLKNISLITEAWAIIN